MRRVGALAEGGAPGGVAVVTVLGLVQEVVVVARIVPLDRGADAEAGRPEEVEVVVVEVAEGDGEGSGKGVGEERALVRDGRQRERV